MNNCMVEIDGLVLPLYTLDTIIVGSGAAGLNAADSLYSLGRQDIAILTEGMAMGTSRNTGSDKQTYYKLTLAGAAQDSVHSMAETLFAGGAMHGDVALVEAALSTRCFYKLVEAGVPFPHDGFGQYAGYKTDHDPRQRATSAGPLTSRYMTEALERKVLGKGIAVFDGYLAIAILTEDCEGGDERRAIGLLALNLNDLETGSHGLTLFNCENIVWATGGPAGIYASSVYPQSQFGALGIALEAGARGVNLTESQYGLASIKFRWNLSGTYQQVLPRYISTDSDGGDEREFLQDAFPSAGKMLNAVFLKGYQWPFDPRKAGDFGSSLIDLLVYRETEMKGRRVFLDYTRNPDATDGNGELDFSLLGNEAREYLEKSGVLFGTPIDRLKVMNAPAIQLYLDHGIDLTKERLEIAVCAQHCNGGLLADTWWESNLRHFFPVGEAAGTFGVYRPGGSALNSTQVGSLRAAQYISLHYKDVSMAVSSFLHAAKARVGEKIGLIQKLLGGEQSGTAVLGQRELAQRRMTGCGAHIRSLDGVRAAQRACRQELAGFTAATVIGSAQELPDAFRNYDMLLTQVVFLGAIGEYIGRSGGSRGSYLITDPSGGLPAPGLPEEFRHRPDSGELAQLVCEAWLDSGDLTCGFEWKPVRPIPQGEPWFENVWREFREREAGNSPLKSKI